MGIKDLVLNKGWAGRTIGRSETVDRVNPVIVSLTRLMHLYNDASTGLSLEDDAAFQGQMKLLRADIGKLVETVHSAGGVAYSGVDIEPGDITAGDTPTKTLHQAESDFIEGIEAEVAVEHQIHTRAVFGAVQANAKERLKMIRELARR
jgi:hypothetical protein